MQTLDPSDIRRLVASVPHWHHILTFPHGIATPGAYDPASLLQKCDLPDLRGKRVLDVGTRDGFFAFECERRGAEVVAIDHIAPHHTGFETAKAIYGSKVEYVQANVYEITPERFGTFDVILFLGVLYHLRHPLLALDRLRGVCRELLIVESLVCDARVFTGMETGRPLAELAPGLGDIPIAQFLPMDVYHRDHSNIWSPNVACLRAMIEDAQFTTAMPKTWGDRALVQARPKKDERATWRAVADSGLVP